MSHDDNRCDAQLLGGGALAVRDGSYLSVNNDTVFKYNHGADVRARFRERKSHLPTDKPLVMGHHPPAAYHMGLARRVCFL